MIAIVPQTRKQKIKMYMKFKKRQLAEMLATRDMHEEASGHAGMQITFPKAEEGGSNSYMWHGDAGKVPSTLTVS